MHYLYLGIVRSGNDWLLEGDRDALVTLRSTINEALRNGRATADLTDSPGGDRQVVVLRVGP